MKASINMYHDRTFVGEFVTQSKTVPPLRCPVGGMSVRKEDDLPPGEYDIIAAVKIPMERLSLRMEIGPRVLIFRNVLYPFYTFGLHGGMPDSYGDLRPTDGGARVHNEHILSIASQVKQKKSLRLTVNAVDAGATHTLLGPRVSDESHPTLTVLREILLEHPLICGNRIAPGKLWSLFLEHHAWLGCTVCKRW